MHYSHHMFELEDIEFVAAQYKASCSAIETFPMRRMERYLTCTRHVQSGLRQCLHNVMDLSKVAEPQYLGDGHYELFSPTEVTLNPRECAEVDMLLQINRPKQAQFEIILAASADYQVTHFIKAPRLLFLKITSRDRTASVARGQVVAIIRWRLYEEAHKLLIPQKNPKDAAPTDADPTDADRLRS
mmetsp:Transcript_30186/g.92329  ORF Transcript_30186/g.92329 Transcript_30186/m.92329 type:complete len:186 (-) Transcript_30186:284-841(-)